MGIGHQHLDTRATPTGLAGVFTVSIADIDLDRLPATIGGRPITALAPHPHDDDQFYVTLGHPETLGFLPDPYIDLRD